MKYIKMRSFLMMILMMILVVIGFLIRVFNIDLIPLRWDEGTYALEGAFTVELILENLNNPVKVVYSLLGYKRSPFNRLHPPLGNFLNGISIVGFGNLGFPIEFGARFISIISGTLAGVWAYLIFSKILNHQRTGLFVACIFLFYPPLVNMSRDSHFYTAVMSQILFLILLMGTLDLSNLRHSALFGLSVGLFMIYDYSCVYFAIVLCFIVMLYGVIGTIPIKSLIVFGGILFLSAGWFYLFLVLQPIFLPTFYGSTSLLDAGLQILKSEYNLMIFYRIAIYQVPQIPFLGYNDLEIDPLLGSIFLICLCALVVGIMVRGYLNIDSEQVLHSGISEKLSKFLRDFWIHFITLIGLVVYLIVQGSWTGVTKDYPHYKVHLLGIVIVLVFISITAVYEIMKKSQSWRLNTLLDRIDSTNIKHLKKYSGGIAVVALSTLLIGSQILYPPIVPDSDLDSIPLRNHLANDDIQVLILVGFPVDYNVRIIAAYCVYYDIELYRSNDNLTILPDLHVFQPWKRVLYPVFFDDWDSLKASYSEVQNLSDFLDTAQLCSYKIGIISYPGIELHEEYLFLILM